MLGWTTENVLLLKKIFLAHPSRNQGDTVGVEKGFLVASLAILFSFL